MSRRLGQDRRLYAGAAGRASLSQAARSGSKYAVVPKVDGSLVTIVTASDGKVAHLILRNGGEMPRNLMAEFRGVKWWPSSVLAAEAEAWSEASNRVAATRGWRALHIFDAQRIGGQDFTQAPYAERRDALLRAESMLVQDDLDKPWLADAQGDAHDPTTGRYVRPVPRSWRRCRVVPQMPAHRADAAWSEWVDQEGAGGPCEGLVLVRLDARLGARSSKRKIKKTETLDAVVVDVKGGSAFAVWGGQTFRVGTGRHQLRAGSVIEVACEGAYETVAIPKHPRIVRVRHDLQGGQP